MSHAVDALKLAVDFEKQALEKYKEAIPHVTNEQMRKAVEKYASAIIIQCNESICSFFSEAYFSTAFRVVRWLHAGSPPCTFPGPASQNQLLT